MARYGSKWLYIVVTGSKRLHMALNDSNGYKCLEMAGNDWNGWKFLKMA